MDHHRQLQLHQRDFQSNNAQLHALMYRVQIHFYRCRTSHLLNVKMPRSIQCHLYFIYSLKTAQHFLCSKDMNIQGIGIKH